MSKISIEHQSAFKEVHQMIQTAKQEASRQANKLLISLYWSIGQYINQKISSSAWGESVVDTLSKYLTSKEPGIKGFSSRNIWRMKKFYETYQDDTKLSALLTEIT